MELANHTTLASIVTPVALFPLFLKMFEKSINIFQRGNHYDDYDEIIAIMSNNCEYTTV